MVTENQAKPEERVHASPQQEHQTSLPLLSLNAIRQLPFPVSILDRDGRATLTNAAWQRLQLDLELSGEEASSAALVDFNALRQVCPEASRIRAGIGKVLQKSRPTYSTEFRIKAPRKHRWFQLRAELLETGSHVLLTLTETTHQHKIEQDLRESHSLFHRIVESTGDAIFIYDTQGHFLMHNSACVDLFSNTSGKLIGRSISDLFEPEIAQTIRNNNELVLNTGRTIGYEIVLKHPAGERTLLIQQGLYHNHHNQVAGIIGISRDITERKLAEEKMERSERHFRALIEKSGDCIGIISAKGDVLYVSPQARRMFGFDIEQLIGSNCFFWAHPDEVKKGREMLEKLVARPGASITSETRALCQDGSWKWVEVTASNLLNEPSVQAVILNARDITERKRTEHELSRFQAIVEYSIDAIFSTDTQGRITSWNAAATRIFGYSEEEMLGSSATRLIPKDHRKEGREFFYSAFQGKAVRDMETVREAKDGRLIEVALTHSPIYDRAMRIVGSAVIVRDITDRRRLEKEVLEISDFEKHRIGQDLHDDLCQHLVGITMLSSTLQRDLEQYGLKQAADAGQITDMLRNAVDHARNLARGLSPLDFSHGGLMAGLQRLVTNTERLFRIPCQFECSEPIHIEDHEVATHLFRIAQEALHNAVKHSQGTQVVIGMERCGRVLEISVRDDGVGLPEIIQASGSGGLGMHTMRYRARIIGAVLSTARNAGGGSTITCRYPLSRAEKGNEVSQKGCRGLAP